MTLTPSHMTQETMGESLLPFLSQISNLSQSFETMFEIVFVWASSWASCWLLYCHHWLPRWNWFDLSIWFPLRLLLVVVAWVRKWMRDCQVVVVRVSLMRC